MDSKEAREIRENWVAMGKQPCNHPRKEKELVFGSDTGDRICIQCGKAFYDGMPDEDNDE